MLLAGNLEVVILRPRHTWSHLRSQRTFTVVQKQTWKAFNIFIPVSMTTKALRPLSPPALTLTCPPAQLPLLLPRWQLFSLVFQHKPRWCHQRNPTHKQVLAFRLKMHWEPLSQHDELHGDIYLKPGIYECLSAQTPMLLWMSMTLLFKCCLTVCGKHIQCSNENAFNH